MNAPQHNGYMKPPPNRPDIRAFGIACILWTRSYWKANRDLKV
jgi:hypothetical protein